MNIQQPARLSLVWLQTHPDNKTESKMKSEQVWKFNKVMIICRTHRQFILKFIPCSGCWKFSASVNLKYMLMVFCMTKIWSFQICRYFVHASGNKQGEWCHRSDWADNGTVRWVGEGGGGRGGGCDTLSTFLLMCGRYCSDYKITVIQFQKQYHKQLTTAIPVVGRPIDEVKPVLSRFCATKMRKQNSQLERTYKH